MSDRVNVSSTPGPATSEGEEALFVAALEQPESERSAFLDQACQGKAALRQRIDILLRANAQPDPSLAFPEDDILVSARSLRFDADRDDAVGQTVGRYKLLQRIGEGGCGVVYLAEQTEPVRRRVALKVIKLGMDTKAVIARFEAERQALAMMDHPNIARVLDAGATESGRPYFIMELVQGIRITNYCDQNRLGTRERLDLFVKVCQAIQHAHQKGIIHRDIKPSNILVSLHDGVSMPKVIDFGIFKATEGPLTDATVHTQLHQFVGTPAYMSPEQVGLSGSDIDTRSDIYSLGVLLYELLTGHMPFDTQSLLSSGLDALRQIIREQEPVRPSTKLRQAERARRGSGHPAARRVPPSQLDPDLDWIVMKCLEKDRSRRYETANGLAADVKRYLADESVVARPPSASYRFQKTFRRHRLVFIAGTAVAAALLLATGVSTWQVIETRKARNAETVQRITAQSAQKRAEIARAAELQERLRANAEKLTAERHLYAANMNLAQQAWDQPNFVRLQQLLEETQDSPFRGFEWFYWQHQAHLPLKTLRGHLATVNAAAFSPDGQRILTGAEDCTAIVWESASGRALRTFQEHTGMIWSVSFSPDGQRVLTGAGDQTARVWEVASGREVLMLPGHPYRIYAVAFSPDGLRIATRSGASSVTLWDAASGRECLTLKGHTGTIYSVNFCSDGQRLVTSSADHTAKVWDAVTARESLTLKGHLAPVSSASFSRDALRIVTSSEDQTAKVWDAATGAELLTLKGHTGPVWSVAIAPDSRCVATASQDQTVKIWAADTGRELRTLRGHTASIQTVAFSSDGQRIVTAGNDGTARIWDANLDSEGLILNGHRDEIRGVAFSPDGRRIVTASKDQTAKIWDVQSGRELVTFKEHTGQVRAAAFSPDGQLVVTASKDQTARIWEAVSARSLVTFHGHSYQVSTVDFSPDGRRIVTGSDDDTAKVWDVKSGRELLTLKGTNLSFTSVAFAPDGQRIVSCGAEAARVWDANTGKELLALIGHTSSLWSAVYSKDGRRILTASFDRTAKVWDAATGRELLTLRGHREPIQSAVFSPDGQRIVTGSYDHTAKVWETITGRDLLTLKGHNGHICSVAFSPDGQRIVTSSVDQTARVWSAALPEQILDWQREEREATQYLATVQQQRSDQDQRKRLSGAVDEGAVKRWRVLAPIPLAPGQTGAEGLMIEQIPGEARLQPRGGESRAFRDRELRWQDVVLRDELLDFKPIIGRATSRTVAYAVCYLWSDAELHNLRMLVGSSDEATVYLNGRRVHKWLHVRGYGRERDTVPDITLVAGANLVVFKLVNELNDWKASLRFTDAQGLPLRGIKVMLDPEG